MKMQTIPILDDHGTEELFEVADLVNAAMNFKSTIHISIEQITINAKSYMGMCVLTQTPGDSLTVTAEGADEDLAIESFCDLLRTHLKQQRRRA